MYTHTPQVTHQILRSELKKKNMQHFHILLEERTWR